MAGLFIFYFLKHDSSRWQVALGGIVVSALPLLLLRVKHNPFNNIILIGYFVFIFCSTFLGSIALFYLHHKWWDTTLHFYKGAYVAYVGLALFNLFIPKSAISYISDWILFLYLLSLSVTASVLWEIYEFLGDKTFTHTMQRGGNTDTMIDLIAGLVGGLLMALFSIKRKQVAK
nr:membrane-spanning protein [Neobacillus terrae]